MRFALPSGRLACPGLLALALANATASAAQKLLQNPDFDDFTAGFAGWSSTGVDELEGADADDCPDSGSFHVDSSSGDPSSVTSETCIPVTTNDTLYLELTYRSEVDLHLHLAQYLDSSCAGADFALLEPTTQPASFDWTTARVTKVISEAQTAAVRFQPVATEGEDGYDALFGRA